MRRSTLLALCWCALLAGAWSLPAQAFEKDTHYYLTFALALRCCLSYEDAWLVASANWAVDTSESTQVEWDDGERNRDWHALSEDGSGTDERKSELKDRVSSELVRRKQLIKFGQLLHFVQDTYSHEGYGPGGTDHAIDTVLRGQDPDSLATDRTKTAGMINETISLLCVAAEEIRSRGRIDWSRLDKNQGQPTGQELNDWIDSVQNEVGTGDGTVALQAPIYFRGPDGSITHILDREPAYYRMRSLALGIESCSRADWKQRDSLPTVTWRTGAFNPDGEKAMERIIEEVKDYVLDSRTAREKLPGEGEDWDFPEPQQIEYDSEGEPIG